MTMIDEDGVSYEDVWWFIQNRDLPPESKIFMVEEGVQYELYYCGTDSGGLDITFIGVPEYGKEDAPVMTVGDLRAYVRKGRSRAQEPQGPAWVWMGADDSWGVVAVELQKNCDSDHPDYGQEAILLHVDFDALQEDDNPDDELTDN